MHIITWKKLILRSYILSDSNCIVTERCRVGMFGAQKPVKKLVENKVCFISETDNLGGRGHTSNQKGQPPPTPN